VNDRDLFFSTLRMYELAEGQPKAKLLEASADVGELVEDLFDGCCERGA